MSLFAWTTAGTGLALAVMTGMYLVTDAKLDASIAREDLRLEQIATLEGAITTQEGALEAGRQFAVLGAETSKNMAARLAEADKQALTIQREISALLAKEEQNAISNPQGRARASQQRLCSILQLASSGENIQGCDNTGTVAPDSSGTAGVSPTPAAVASGSDDGERQ